VCVVPRNKLVFVFDRIDVGSEDKTQNTGIFCSFFKLSLETLLAWFYTVPFWKVILNCFNS